MASLVLGAVGSAVAGPVGGFIGGTLGGFIDQALFAQKGQDTFGPRLHERDITASTYGQPWPIIYGTQRVGGNIIWVPPIVEHTREEEIGGAKGIGGTASHTSYYYTASWDVGFCVGPVDKVLRIWFGPKLVYDVRSGGPVFGYGLNASHIRIYLGGEAQLPDPAIEADLGVDDASAHRGLCHVVFDDVPLANFGNTRPPVRAEITSNASDAVPSTELTSSNVVNNGTFNHDKTQYVAFGNDLVVYDTINKVELARTTLGPDPARTVPMDADGNIYARNSDAGSTSSVYKYNPLTGQLVARSATSAFPDNGIVELLLLGEPGFEKLLALGQTDKVGVFSTQGGAAFGGSATVTTMTLLHSWDLTSFFAESPNTTYSMNLANGAVLDGDGNPWCLSAAGDGIGRLWKLDKNTGQPLTNYHTVYDGSVSDEPDNIAYDPVTNSIVVADGDASLLLKFDLDSLAFVAKLSSGVDDIRSEAAFANGPTGGKLWFSTGSFARAELDFESFTITRTVNSIDWSVGDVRATVYDPLNHAIIAKRGLSGTAILWLYLDRATGAGVTLSSIVDDLSDEVGLDTSADLDTSALDSDTVRGYVVSRRMEARQAIETLMPGFFFDAVESDGKIKYVKRGGSVAFTIANDDMGARSRAAQNVPSLSEWRQQEVELPERLDLQYSDPAFDYQQGTQHAKRLREAVYTRDLLTVNMPVVFTKDEAKTVATKLLYLLWLERQKYNWNLSWEFIRIDPTDVVQLTDDDAVVHEVFVRKTDFNPDGVIDFEGVANDAAIQDISETGADVTDGFTAPEVVVSGPSGFFVLDTPLFRDQDSELGVYVAAGPYGGDTSWPGANIYQSTDATSWSGFATIASSRDVDFGYATEALAAPPGNRWTTWDRTNTINVKLYNGTLASDTELNVLNGANALLIGNEIIKFATATLESDGTYTLSNLIRGRRGTEWAVGDHVAGERVVVLSSSTLTRVTLSTAKLNTTDFFRGVTNGSTIAASAQKSLTHTLASAKPYSVCHIEGTLGSPQDWLFSWLRRTRIGGAWLDTIDVPLSEASENYEIDVMNGSTVVRTITTTASANGSVVNASARTAWYTQADQVADFGSVQSSITIKIYQISAAVGRGFGRTETLLAA